MKILITGASGFIGAYLVEKLSPSHEVAGLMLPGESIENCQLSKIFRGDVTVPASLLDACSWPDIVIHAAGLTKTRRPRDYFKVNTRGTKNIVKVISRVNPNLKKFIFFSSVAAAGPAKGPHSGRERTEGPPHHVNRAAPPQSVACGAFPSQP